MSLSNADPRSPRTENRKPSSVLCLLALALAAAGLAAGCDPVGRGLVAEGVPEPQLAKTVHPTHNVFWSPALGPAASGDFHCAALADLDGDGIPDIAAGGFDRRGVRVWLANGDGTWSSIDGPRHLGLPTGIALGDVDKDGRIDMVVAGRGEVPGVRVWLNTDEVIWKEGPPATITLSYLAVTLADINKDGYPDIIAARESGGLDSGNGGIAVWLNRAGKGWTTDVGPKATEGYNDIALGDFNNDGNLDLVGARWGNPGGLDLWYGNGHDAWDRAKEDPAIKLNYQGVDVGDFNGDGWLDIVATSYRSDLGACIFLNDRRGGWWSVPVPLSAKGSFWDAKAADFNNDGLLDVAVTSFDDRGVRVWLQLPREDPLKTERKPGEPPRFLVPQFVEQSFRFPHKGTYRPINAADFNGDGKLDLVAGAGDEGVKVWFQTDPQGNLKRAANAREVAVSEKTPRLFGEVDEAAQEPLENRSFVTIQRDDGFTYTEYRIGIGDLLRIEIYPGRSADPRVIDKAVEASGELLIPLVSRDPLRIVEKNGRGLSPTQVRSLILTKLAGTFHEPSVAVTVERAVARKVSVLGEIRIKPNEALTGPGQYAIFGKTRVLDFIARHGGFTERADLTKVEVRNRDGEKRVVDLFKAIFQSKLSQDVVLDDSDVVTVPSTAMSERKIYVLGEVSAPGVYTLEDNVRLIEGVQLAQSFTRRANRKQVIVIRGDKEKPQFFEINMVEMLEKGDLSKNIMLQDGDVVFVPKDWIANIVEFYSWFLPGWYSATNTVRGGRTP